MDIFKKHKIRAYLKSLGSDKSPFDLLLSDYVTGDLKKNLKKRGLLKNIVINVNFDGGEKCILVQGMYWIYRIDMDIRIYPDEFTISYDASAPDNGKAYPLDSRERIYTTLLNIIKIIHMRLS
jgi:hypothetical protein